MNLRKLMRRLLTIVLGMAGLVVLLAITVYLVRAFDARHLPDLDPWHEASLDSEFRQDDKGPETTLADYLRMEDELFAELDREVHAKVEPGNRLYLSRFSSDGPNNPTRFDRNWNRSFELVPADIRGGALLLHGLTDSPYSLRRIGELFEAHGFYVLGLRLPGHGTAPAALASITWQDWMAAARVGARHVHERIGDRGPLYVVGYSNGGALAVKYGLEAIDEADLPRPDHLILFSPAIGVTRFAALSGWHKALSWMPYFEKFSWMSIEPEIDPYKYTSFPKNAGRQTHLLTRAVQKHIAGLEKAGRMSELPPVLAFQSLVDTTVLTDAAVERFFNKLEAPGSELVIFDVNRVATLRYLFTRDHVSLLRTLESRPALPYRLTVITNVGEDSLEVMERTRPPGSPEFETTSLGLAWPSQVYSLSHIALPFSTEDWVYGSEQSEATGYGVRLGSVQPRGERDMLRLPLAHFMRLRHNPFFDYVEERLREVLAEEEGTEGVIKPQHSVP
ncbi:MAG: alpha/beta hydrolase [Planctomycetota bacterium]|jgi:alpha-beta hydrolase superfamily lysophospholipase